jgi:hypothetical protein
MRVLVLSLALGLPYRTKFRVFSGEAYTPSGATIPHESAPRHWRGQEEWHRIGLHHISRRRGAGVDVREQVALKDGFLA